MIKNFLKKYFNIIEKRIVERDDLQKFILGKQLCFSQKSIEVTKLSDIEFKVFSQWGEDGIIEYLINKLPIENKFFIEFGVENYNESNTRFLMMNRNWAGLIIDGSKENIDYIRKRDYFWKYDLTAIDSFITKENINSLISDELKKLNANINIGLLSVDIDGVDYWILNEINCINPSIIICEYNSVFGNKQPLTVPYDKEFIRGNKHHSNLYFGANLKAFDNLLNERGYIYIGSNMQNSNAFFVKKELAEKHLPRLIENIPLFEFSKMRESRDKDGNLSFLSGEHRIKEIKDLELVNLETNMNVKIEELL
jgi:hypothetical protein